jgi:hypothetical protein
MWEAFGLLNPLTLSLGIPILAGLVYAYLRKKKLPIITVPSLFLLRDLSLPISTRKKFAPPWRFWFELLILSLLLLCLAGLFTTQESARYALIFDNSLSLAAQKNGKSLIELQRAELKKTLESLPDNSLFDLYKTSPQLERIGGKDLSPSLARQYVEELKAVYAKDSLSEVIGLVAQRETYSGIVVFTDRSLQVEQNPEDKGGGISMHRVSFPNLQNIALVSPQQKDDQLQVSMRSYGIKQKADAVVALEVLSTEGSWRELKRQSQPISESKSSVIQFALPESKLEAYRVTIVEPKSGSEMNALAEDDQIYFSSKRTQPGVQVFSLRTLSDLGIEKIRGIKFTAAKIENYESVRARNPNDVFLFVDYVPQGLPDRGSIVVSPPQSSGGFEIGDIVSQAEISEWNSGHPLLTYIDVSTLKLSRFIPIRPPIWGTSIVSTVRGSVLIAGERAGNRYVVLGFDLFPYRGRGSPTQSVMFLNMLAWVSGGRAASSSTPPFQPFAASVAGTVIEELGQEASKESLAAGVSFIPEHPGIFLSRSPNGAEQTSLVNFIDNQESQLSINEAESLIAPIKGIQIGAKVERRRTLTDFAIPLLLAILCIDFILSLISALPGIAALRLKKRRA